MEIEVASGDDTMNENRRVGGILAVTFVSLVLIVLSGPILLLAIFSFNDSSIIALPFEGATIRWYQEALGDPNVQTALRNSVVLAAVVALVCVVLGAATAWGITRFRFRGRGFWSGLAGAPLIVPWLVIGVSGLIFFVYLRVDLSLVTIGVMQLAVTFPLVTTLVAAQLVRFERSQEEAAVDLGASQLQLMTRVVLPQLAPTLTAAMILAFTWSFNNFEISFFTGGYDQTFPVWVYSVLRRSSNLPVVNAVSTLVSAVQIGVVYVLWMVLRSVGKRRSASSDPTQLVTGGLL